MAKDYGVAKIDSERKVAAPRLAYEPIDPKRYSPPIGLIGCGGITQSHLKAYKAAGYHVVALCDRNEEKAEARRKEFFPKARIYTDYRELLKRDDIEVVDIATHPSDRVPIVEAALRAKKHVLSQKPFALDLTVGKRLADLADSCGVHLAVNQNGRWSPHFSYLHRAIDAGLIGSVISVHMSVHWNHNWILGTPFEEVRHVVLFDFGIHWFDLVTCFFGKRKPKRVYASMARAVGQRAKPPMLGLAIIEFDGGQASLAFDADTRYGPQDRTYIAGTKGTLTSIGRDLTRQTVTLHTAKGVATPKLKGSWFPDGFHGAMAELLCAIEAKRIPENNARDNLNSLGLCFAAAKSAETGKPQTPGTVLRMPK